MKMIYGIKDKPPVKQMLIFALQQLLAIIAATILVPILVNAFGEKNLHMDPAAALFGAGVGTLVYYFFTRGKSPVFLGSSFAFLNSMYAATAFGYLGILFGAIFAGLVYVVVALIIKAVGSGWVNKLLPPVIIGPTIALIGLSLAGSAVSNLNNTASSPDNYNLLHILCGLFAFAVVIYCVAKGAKFLSLIPFVVGVGAGYALAWVFTVFGIIFGCEYLMIVNYQPIVDCFVPFNYESIFRVPDFAFFHAIKEFSDFEWRTLGKIALLYAPVAFVVMAEHIGDHKNLSAILSTDEEPVDLLADPGLDNTLLGDGVGTMVGALFGGCPNTTYGESVGCVAITKNASAVTILTTAFGALLLSFFSPFVALVNSLPACIVGGICLALYGFIAVSGLKMIQKVDLEDSRNLFVVSSILITGIGGLTLNFDEFVVITTTATALIIGILVNLMMRKLPAMKGREEDEE